MRNKILLLTCLLISGYVKISNAQSYEGYISGNLPVWFDLNIPSPDGPVTGTYFYKKHGGNISLSGTLEKRNLILNEKNKDGVITGIFSCVHSGDSITGSWNKPNSTKLLTIILYKTNPSFKRYAQIPGNDQLILASGRTLNDELKRSADDGVITSKLVYVFAERSILSTYYGWQVFGAYLSVGEIYHTFDLTNHKEINIMTEIDPDRLWDFKDKIKSYLQKELDSNKKNNKEEEWIKASLRDRKAYESIFQLSSVKDEDIYLGHGQLHIVIKYYGGIQNVMSDADLFFELKMPFSELTLYLKENSILNNLK